MTMSKAETLMRRRIQELEKALDTARKLRDREDVMRLLDRISLLKNALAERSARRGS